MPAASPPSRHRRGRGSGLQLSFSLFPHPQLHEAPGWAAPLPEIKNAQILGLFLEPQFLSSFHSVNSERPGPRNARDLSPAHQTENKPTRAALESPRIWSFGACVFHRLHQVPHMQGVASSEVPPRKLKKQAAGLGVGKETEHKSGSRSLGLLNYLGLLGKVASVSPSVRLPSSVLFFPHLPLYFLWERQPAPRAWTLSWGAPCLPYRHSSKHCQCP